MNAVTAARPRPCSPHPGTRRPSNNPVYGEGGWFFSPLHPPKGKRSSWACVCPPKGAPPPQQPGFKEPILAPCPRTQVFSRAAARRQPWWVVDPPPSAGNSSETVQPRWAPCSPPWHRDGTRMDATSPLTHTLPQAAPMPVALHELARPSTLSASQRSEWGDRGASKQGWVQHQPAPSGSGGGAPWPCPGWGTRGTHTHRPKEQKLQRFLRAGSVPHGAGSVPVGLKGGGVGGGRSHSWGWKGHTE